MSEVTVGARIHLGFSSLSLGHDRIYGAAGLGLEDPSVKVRAQPASEVNCGHELGRVFANRSVDVLGLPGAEVTVEDDLPRHVGLGSGTQLALAVYTAIARSHDLDPSVRQHSPSLGRGGRSGVGVATFERGGFILDAGHPTDSFTPTSPNIGEWRVPDVICRHEVPENWRIILGIPDATPGRFGEDEANAMRSTLQNVEPESADKAAGIILRKLLPGIVEGNIDRFGAAAYELGQLNGKWFSETGVQEDTYRPPANRIIRALSHHDCIAGVGQSSWGPAIYAFTTRSQVTNAKKAVDDAVSSVGGGSVRAVKPRNEGARNA
ncbi:MAG: beta-ribofuranosylaminobenzene 5'-phosphate synthase family protein [Halobacteriaceae archaeon]